MKMSVIERTTEEINEVLNRCYDQEEEGGSAYPGMSYEQGIRCAIEWLTNKDSDPLFDND